MLFASLSLSDLWRATEHVDRTMFPYYAVVSPLSSISQLRWLSLMAGGIASASAAVMSAKWWGWPAGIVAGTFIIVNPLMSPYFVEARSYTLAVALFMFSSLVLTIGRPNTARGLLYASALTGSLLMNMLMAPAILVHVLHVAGRGELRGSKWIWVAWTAAFMCPLTLLMSSEITTGQLSWVPAPDIASASDFLLAASGQAWFWYLLGLVLLVLLAGWRRPTRIALFPVYLVTVPITLNLALTWAVTSIFYPRYLLLVVGGFALIMAGFVGLASNHPFATILLLLATAAAAWLTFLDHRPSGGTPTTVLAEKFAEHAQPGDLLHIEQGQASSGHLAAIALSMNDNALWEESRRLAIEEGPVVRVVSRIVELEADGIRTAVDNHKIKGRVWAFGRVPLAGCRLLETNRWGGFTVHLQYCDP